MNSNINSESKATKVAGFFNDGNSAQSAFDNLLKQHTFDSNALKLIAPHDQHFGEKVEPEDKNIGKTLLRTHLIYAVFGLVVGVLISSFLLILDLSFMQLYVIETFAAISVICVFIAMLAAGFMSIRPDHDPLINDVRKATQSGKWVVLVHTNEHDKVDTAKNIMKPFAVSTTATL